MSACNCCEKPPEAAIQIVGPFNCGIIPSVEQLDESTGVYYRRWQTDIHPSGRARIDPVNQFSRWLRFREERSGGFFAEFHSLGPSEDKLSCPIEFDSGGTSGPGDGTTLWEVTEPVTEANSFRVVHSPVASGYLKVWLKLIHVISNNLSEDGPGIANYTWTPDVAPLAIADITKPFNADENLVTSDWIQLPLFPEVHQGVEIEKYSYLPGYAPDISDPLNPQPNGWPDPAWSSA